MVVRSRGRRCCTRDGGWLALQSRPAEEGSKPPRGALAEDRGPERRWKRRGKGPRQVGAGKMSDGCESSVVDVSKPVQLTSKPGLAPHPGISLGDIRLPPRWCPAYRQHEPGPGSRTEHVKARKIRPVLGLKVRPGRGERENPKRQNPQGEEYRCGSAGGLVRSSCDPPAYRSGLGSEGMGSSG